MTPLEESLNEIMYPSNFIKNFADDDHFITWARQGCLSDLRDTRNIFEKHEEYHHCALLQRVIDEKVDEMLEGFGFTD